jgi:hypothetical protein
MFVFFVWSKHYKRQSWIGYMRGMSPAERSEWVFMCDTRLAVVSARSLSSFDSKFKRPTRWTFSWNIVAFFLIADCLTPLGRSV